MSVLTDFGSIQDDLASILYNLFGTSTTVHLNVSVGDTGSGVPGITINTQGLGPNWEYGFSADVVLSQEGGYNNCSQDYILSTFAHESLHSYIELQRRRLGQDSLTSIYNFTTSGDDYTDEHIIMAQSYVDQMAQLLLEYNPGLSLPTRLALALEGLQGTSVWQDVLNHYGMTEADIISVVGAASCQPNTDNSALNLRLCN